MGPEKLGGGALTCSDGLTLGRRGGGREQGCGPGCICKKTQQDPCGVLLGPHRRSKAPLCPRDGPASVSLSVSPVWEPPWGGGPGHKPTGPFQGGADRPRET